MSEKLEPISEQPDLVFRLVFARAKEWPHQSTSVSGWGKMYAELHDACKKSKEMRDLVLRAIDQRALSQFDEKTEQARIQRFAKLAAHFGIPKEEIVAFLLESLPKDL